MSAAVKTLTRQMYGTCFRKQRFAEQWQASGTVKHATAKGKDIGRPYQCQHCRGWHVGHRGKKAS